jgi:hypothetical protein
MAPPEEAQDYVEHQAS